MRAEQDSELEVCLWLREMKRNQSQAGDITCNTIFVLTAAKEHEFNDEQSVLNPMPTAQ